MSESLTELQKIQLQSLMIYDSSDQMAELIYNIKQAICRVRCYYLMKAQFMDLRDLKNMEIMIHRKIREKHEEIGLIVECYFYNVNIYKVYFPTRSVHISIRIVCSGGEVLIYKSGKI